MQFVYRRKSDNINIIMSMTRNILSVNNGDDNY